MKILALAFILMSKIALSASPLASLSLNETRNSYMLSTLIEHLKLHATTPEQQKEVLTALKKLNENLASVPYKNFLLFLDTELTKSVLNFSNNNDDLDLSGNQITNAQDNFEKKKNELTEYTQFIFQRILTDFSPYVRTRLVFNYKNPKYQTEENRPKIRQIKLLNKYLGSKLNYLTSINTIKINRYMTRMAIDSLNKLAISSYALKFASDSLPNKLIIIEGLEKAFQLTQQKIQEKPQNTSPQEIIKNLDVKADPTDKIDELIEDVAPNKN
mgnify:CR=1 FL=1